MTTSTMLIDELTVPSVRQTLGQFLAESVTADFAVAKVRLGGLDLNTAELQKLRACRLLLGRLDADILADVAADSPDAAARAAALCGFIDTGRVEIRAAGTGAWSPDFSILQTTSGYRLLVGGHYFGRPEPPGGAVFTCVICELAAVTRARHRFLQLWDGGYDVLPVIRAALDVAAQPAP